MATQDTTTPEALFGWGFRLEHYAGSIWLDLGAEDDDLHCLSADYCTRLLAGDPAALTHEAGFDFLDRGEWEDLIDLPAGLLPRLLHGLRSLVH